MFSGISKFIKKKEIRIKNKHEAVGVVTAYHKLDSNILRLFWDKQ